LDLRLVVIFAVTDVHRDRDCRACPHDAARRQLHIFANSDIGTFVDRDLQILKFVGCEEADYVVVLN
jgi:hypothetical protein